MTEHDLATQFESGVTMEIKMVMTGPSGEMWSQVNRYKKLPVRYLFEIASACGSLAEFVRGASTGQDEGKKGDQYNTPKGSGRDYQIDFEYGCEVEVPPPFDDFLKGEVSVSNLLYSKAYECQRAGWTLLGRLLDGAEIEIKAGQRS